MGLSNFRQKADRVPPHANVFPSKTATSDTKLDSYICAVQLRSRKMVGACEELGVLVGQLLGYADGSVDGLCEGWALGLTLGDLEGCADGRVVG